MRRATFFLAAMLACALPHGAAAAECVTLVHGIARSSGSMAALEAPLREAGYIVFNWDYPSRQHPIEELAKLLAPALAEGCAGAERLSFVTHSMGGLVVRMLASQNPTLPFGRVVMLAPPNQGSEMADFLQNASIFQQFYGAAGQQLTTKSPSRVTLPEAAPFELGVIAGDWSVDPISSTVIPGVDDGKVAIARTKLEGMRDHITLHTSHSLIMYNREVWRQAVFFLKNGKFDR